MVLPDCGAYTFTLSGADDPATLPRVLEPFAVLGLAPFSVQAHRDAGMLWIDLSFTGLDPDRAETLCRRIGAIVLVAEARMRPCARPDAGTQPDSGAHPEPSVRPDSSVRPDTSVRPETDVAAA